MRPFLSANVDEVTPVWADIALRLTLISDIYPAVELWEAERNAASPMGIAFKQPIIEAGTAVPHSQFGL